MTGCTALRYEYPLSMMTTALSLPGAVVYLLLVFLEVIGAGAPVRADYLQDGEPVARLVAAATDAPQDGYRIVADGFEPVGPLVIDVERGVLTGHHYLVAVPGESLPSVVSLGAVYEQLVGIAGNRSLTLTVDSGAALASGSLDVNLGSRVHVLRYGDLTLLSAPEPGILLAVVEE